MSAERGEQILPIRTSQNKILQEYDHDSKSHFAYITRQKNGHRDSKVFVRMNNKRKLY